MVAVIRLRSTVAWVRAVLFHRAYTDSTRYDSIPDLFLYSLTHLVSVRYHAELHDGLTTFIQERVMERIGARGDPLSLAMRVSTCQALGRCDEIDMRTVARGAVWGGRWRGCPSMVRREWRLGTAGLQLPLLSTLSRER